LRFIGGLGQQQYFAGATRGKRSVCVGGVPKGEFASNRDGQFSRPYLSFVKTS
jgi:hypothetical protein